MNPVGQWFPIWTASSGPLAVSLAGGVEIQSLWIPNVLSAISVAAGVTHLYTTTEPGPEVIPIPPGIAALTLSGGETTPIYVYASSDVFNPYKESTIALTIGGRLTGVAADGSATSHVTISYPFATINSVGLTAGYTGASPTQYPTLCADYENINSSGFDVFVTGGPSGSTCNVDYLINGT